MKGSMVLKRKRYIKKVAEAFLSALIVGSGMLMQSNCVFAGGPGDGDDDSIFFDLPNLSDSDDSRDNDGRVPEGRDILYIDPFRGPITGSLRQATPRQQAVPRRRTAPRMHCSVPLTRSADCFRINLVTMLNDRSVPIKKRTILAIMRPVLDEVGLRGIDRDEVRQINRFYNNFASHSDEILVKTRRLLDWGRKEGKTTAQVVAMVRTPGFTLKSILETGGKTSSESEL